MVGCISAGTATVLLLLSLVPYLHAIWWVFELPSHFSPHLGVVATALGIFALIRNYWRTSVIAGVSAAVYWVTVLTVPSTTDFNILGAAVVSQNLYYANGHAEETRQMLVDENPDIIVLQEYTPEWHRSLKSIADQYQTTITIPQDGAFGIAVYSRLPIRSREILTLGETRVPAIVIEIDAPRVKTYLAAVHFQPPMTAIWSTDRNNQLNELSHHLQELKETFIVVGDFNNTPFSPSLRGFIKETKTKMEPTEWLHTWPSAIGWAGIPIDLALGSEGVTIGAMSKVDSIGSDHRGLRFSIATQLN